MARFTIAREKPFWARAGGRLHGVVRSFARRGRSLRRCASSRGRTNQAPSGRRLGEASEAARLEAQRARADFKAMLERGA